MHRCGRSAVVTRAMSRHQLVGQALSGTVRTAPLPSCTGVREVMAQGRTNGFRPPVLTR